MCGVCGMAGGSEGERISFVRASTVTLSHRGPDAEGMKVLNGAVLGHTRLRILDLSEAGDQPMSCRNGTLWCSYNGEVYNFHDLRCELSAASGGCSQSLSGRTAPEPSCWRATAWGSSRCTTDRSPMRSPSPRNCGAYADPETVWIPSRSPGTCAWVGSLGPGPSWMGFSNCCPGPSFVGRPGEQRWSPGLCLNQTRPAEPARPKWLRLWRKRWRCISCRTCR